MQIIDKPAPNGVVTPGAKTPEQKSARERAISALMGHTDQAQAAVPNQNNVSPEEVKAISTPSTNEIEQNNTIEASVSESAPTSEEPKVEVESKTEPAKDPLSNHYAALAKRERALRAKQAEMKAKEDAMAMQEAAWKSKEQEYSSKYVSKDRLREDALALLAEEGITYEQLTEQALKGPSTEDRQVNQEIKALRAELQKIRDEQDNTKKSYEEQQKNSYKQALKQISTEARQLVANNPEFETIHSTNSVADVVDLIEKTFTEDGVLLSVEEAAKQVEDYLVEEAMKLAKLKKIQERMKLASSPAPAKLPAASSAPVEQPKMKTLTNSMGTSRQLSAKERAILAFKGELK